VFRLFALCNLLVLNLLACKGGYTSCVQKIIDSDTIKNHKLSIPVKNSKRLIYSSVKPRQKVLKSDPFLGLYLIEDKSKFAYDFDVNMRLQLGYAVVTKSGAVEGRIVHNQVGLNSLASFSEKYKVPALLTSSCCALEGIVTSKGIIQKEYVYRFLSNQRSEYSDIGIRVKNKSGEVVVVARDPYMVNNPFKKGDKILSYDGKKVNAASVFMRELLFSKVGSKHKLKIQRDKEILEFSVVTFRRYGGGHLSDTFLESKGLYFDDKLGIVKLSQEFKVYGLHVGDRLISVNGVLVKTQEQLRKYIEDFNDYSSLLFERNDFQFFVNIK